MEFRVLGTLEVVDDGRRLELGQPRQRALLALLVLQANEIVPTERLIEKLWPAGPPGSAAKAVQVYVSQIRKALGAQRDRLETRGPGYALRIEDGELDLRRFEQLCEQGLQSEPAARVELLREALGLWRGDLLADFAYEEFAQAEAVRLAEVRLLALEERLQAELDLGRGRELTPELEELVAAHPLRERPRAQLALALYRAGRQGDALETLREGRRLLDVELGLEPGEDLRELERAILRQDARLAAAAVEAPVRTIVVAREQGAELGAVLPLAAALAAGEVSRELVLVEIVPAGAVGKATAALEATRAELTARGVRARVAAFSSTHPGEDLTRLTRHHDADLVLLAAVADPLTGPFGPAFGSAACDVAAAVGGLPPGSGAVVVPFGAFEHDWAALELGAWAARALQRPLRLVGAADGVDGRDASRLLADASLIVQHTTGVVAEPLLGPPGADSLAALAAGAGLLVVGLSERWRGEGLGQVRAALVASAPAPTLLVRRGLRPGGVGPAATLTRFTWSIARPATTA